MMSERDEQFYKDGLRFDCTGCGNCCKTHDDYAYVYLSHQNIEDISATLGMTHIDFLNAHCANDEYGNVHLTMIKGNCNFLKNNRCTVYGTRPSQCSAWPFWSENLNAETWNGEVADCCPGVNQGRLYTREEIEEIANGRDRAYGIDF
ncbi:MAG: YkgJ family cysteine cluster protein [Deltaproteobacteria bacterium]|nr:YkgJ family cysteine cluster protein [Deltaproteobacteria bacterium]